MDFENSFSGYTAAELPEYEELAGMDAWSYGRWEQKFQDSATTHRLSGRS
jgi:hypothetical protein